MKNDEKLVTFSEVRDCLSGAMADYITDPYTTLSETSAIIVFTASVLDKLRDLPDAKYNYIFRGDKLNG